MTAARRLREEKEAREAKGGGGDDGESHVSIVGLDAFKGRDLTRGALSAMWRWDRVNVLQLAEFTTEKDFASSIERFYFEESMDPSIMVVAADPLLCGASLINHARYICEKQRQARSKWRLINVSAKFQSEVEGYAQTDEGRANMNATGTARTAGGAGGAGGEGGGGDGAALRFVPLFPRHLVFVVHMPPGLQRRQRSFALSFDVGWSYMFVDDLRFPETDANGNLLQTLDIMVR